jgi:hypothetical protein
MEVISGGRIRRVKLNVIKLSSLSFKLDGISYYRPLFLIYLLAINLLELRGEESSN